MKNMKTNTIAMIVIVGLLAAACSGKKEGGGSATATIKVQTTAAVKGKNFILDKDKDYKYALTKIDGNDYVVVKGYNKPEGFKNADTITLKIPNKIEGYTVGAIGNQALEFDNFIVSVTIPDTVIEIGMGAFRFSKKISSIKLPKNLKTLGVAAFSGCTNLGGSIDIPDGVTFITTGAFKETKITEAILPKSVTVIAGEAFNGCKELTSVKLPSGAITYVKSDNISKYDDNGKKRELKAGDVVHYVSISVDGDEVKLVRKVNDGYDEDWWYYEYAKNDAFKDCPKLSLSVRNAIKESGYTGVF